MLRQNTQPQLYPVYCAWCVTHGREPTVIRMVDYEGSHGICPECMQEILGVEKLNSGGGIRVAGKYKINVDKAF